MNCEQRPYGLVCRFREVPRGIQVDELPLAFLRRLYLPGDCHEALCDLFLILFSAGLERLHASTQCYWIKHVLLAARLGERRNEQAAWRRLLKSVLSVQNQRRGARIAWDEGEGDRSLDWWLAAHRRYFNQQAATLGFEMHDNIETVFERFEVVWPPSLSQVDNR
jgi:hypothetical protein